MERFSELEILMFSYITASLASIPLLLWVEPLQWKAMLGMDAKAWIAFAYLALGMYSASMLLFFYVLQRLPVTVVSASMYLLPLFGLAIASITLHEHLSMTGITGAAIVLAATILILRYDSDISREF